MLSTRRNVFLTILALGCAVSLFADEQITGRLVKASVSGTDTTKLYEPLVMISQSSVLDMKSFTLRLSGVRERDSKRYEFYNDEGTSNPFVWKRRTRGVTVRPLNAYITVSAGPENTNIIVINYEYRGRKGFGNVVYVIATEN
ncbi:MAG: hypothetical protein LBO04_08255 [Spirochaetaceae bacterium]|jgi:hypothetical protein|nr:hypothetical protein [Spirochaetaceae bacterium]